MKFFLKLYRWSMQMKLRMGIYIIALLFCKAVWNLCCNIETVKIVEIFTIGLTCFIFAVLETVILPEYNYTKTRTIIWVIVANIIFVSSSLYFGWFKGVSTIGAILLFALLEVGLVMMWYGDNIVMKADTHVLNKQLKKYQDNQKLND